MAEVMEELMARSKQYLKTTVAIEETQYNCSKCKDTGSYLVRKKNGYYIRGVEVEQDYYVVCECNMMLKINRLIELSAITKEFQKMSLKNFSTDNVHPKVVEMKSKVKQYYAAFEAIRGFRQNSIMLVGQPGCGKTHLLTALSNYLIYSKQVPVLYFPYKDGLNKIAANNFERKMEIMTQMKEVDVLFIDDLFKPIGGKVNVKSWQTEVIFEVVNARYLSNKPLLISSELSLDDMLYIDEALTSRLFEMTQDFIVTIPKDKKMNYRLRKLFEKR